MSCYSDDCHIIMIMPEKGSRKAGKFNCLISGQNRFSVLFSFYIIYIKREKS